MEAQDVFGTDFDPSGFGLGSDGEDEPEHGDDQNVLILITGCIVNLSTLE